MATEVKARGSHRAEPTAYETAEKGFPNYWYPVCISKEITEKPSAFKFLGDPITIMRRHGRAYAIADECAHRGTPLSIGKNEFPDTNTIACRYHGWVFDVTNGMCVGALAEGANSKVVGKIRVRSYPVEERKGIVFVWGGKSAPVPVEEDIPSLILNDTSIVKVRKGVKYGNWRWHAENVGAGHAQMLHRDTIGLLFTQFPAHPVEPFAVYGQPEDDDGQWLFQGSKGSATYDDYPGLGRWPKPRPWRFNLRRPRPVSGLNYFGAALRMPGITRVINFPLGGWIYYEWYTPVDEDHYLYFQVSTVNRSNVFSKFWSHLKYHLFGKPFKVVLFNNQDVRMVRHTTDYVKRKGMGFLTPLTTQDTFHIEWRRYASEMVRGEDAGMKARHTAAKPEAKEDVEDISVKEPAVAGGSE
jgi:phenylpropionate dioxygenase-like ring-hydroxylating dioxygenase large terminal subunit